VLRRFSVRDDFGPFYRQNGYVLLRDLFDARDLEAIRRDIIGLWRTQFGGGDPAKPDRRALLKHYTTRPERWRQCARHMWDLLPVIALAARPALPVVLKRAGLAQPVVSTRPEPRVDMPEDKRYMQPWHQDWRYAQTSLNAVTFWTPLHPVNAGDGAIDLIPGSHRLGVLNSKLVPTPRRFEVDDPRLIDTAYETAVLDIGETLLFSQLLAHRSGFNSSGLPRLTIQLRFADFGDRHWKANGYCAPATSDLAWRKLPGRRAVERLFA